MVEHPVVLGQREVKFIAGEIRSIALLSDGQADDLGLGSDQLLNQFLLVRNTLSCPDVVDHGCHHTSSHLSICALGHNCVHPVLANQSVMHPFIMGGKARADDAPTGVLFKHRVRVNHQVTARETADTEVHNAGGYLRAEVAGHLGFTEGGEPASAEQRIELPSRVFEHNL